MPKYGIDSAGSLILVAKGSIIRAKIMGDKGHSWWVPFLMWKALDLSPDTETEAEGLEYNDIKADNIQPENPNLSKTALR